MNNKTINSAESPIEEGLTHFENLESGIDQADQIHFQAIDLSQPLPNLNNLTEYPIDFMSDYWTPAGIGESKRLVFVKISTSLVKPAPESGITELLPLDCAHFLEQDEKGKIRQIRNGSKRLVGVLTDAVINRYIKQGTPLLITYMGKKKNVNGPHSHDNWSVKPLVLNISNGN